MDEKIKVGESILATKQKELEFIDWGKKFSQHTMQSMVSGSAKNILNTINSSPERFKETLKTHTHSRDAIIDFIRDKKTELDRVK